MTRLFRTLASGFVLVWMAGICSTALTGAGVRLRFMFELTEAQRSQLVAFLNSL